MKRCFVTRLLAISMLSLGVMGCGNSETEDESTQKNTDSSKSNSDMSLDQVVFEIVKSNDESRLSEITLAKEQEEKIRANSKMKLEQGLTEHSLKMAKMSLPLLHKQTEQMGFDWKRAILKKSLCSFATAGKEMAEYSKDLDDVREIFLIIESEGKSIGLHLDDCYTVEPGVHVVGDGIRLMSEAKLKSLMDK